MNPRQTKIENYVLTFVEVFVKALWEADSTLSDEFVATSASEAVDKDFPVELTSEELKRVQYSTYSRADNAWSFMRINKTYRAPSSYITELPPH